MTEKAKNEIRTRLVLPAYENGMSDSRWQRIAESIAKKHGITVEDVFYEDDKQFHELMIENKVYEKALGGLNYDKS